MNGKQCLLILDDMWEMKGSEQARMFEELLRCSSNVLLSTRFRIVADHFDAHEVLVGDLDDETASKLFDDWVEEPPIDEIERHLKEEDSCVLFERRADCNYCGI